MVKPAENHWSDFLETLKKVMAKFESDAAYSMEDAFISLREYEKHLDPEVIDFVQNTISEIDGFPVSYSKVLRLAEEGVSQDDFKDYMNRSICDN